MRLDGGTAGRYHPASAGRQFRGEPKANVASVGPGRGKRPGPSATKQVKGCGGLPEITPEVHRVRIFVESEPLDKMRRVSKYEKGMNRVAAGRLYSIAQALGVDISYFYEGLQTADRFLPSPQQRMLLDLARNFLNIGAREHREAIVALTRALAASES